MRPTVEVADIFRAEGPAYRERYGETMPLRHKRAMRAWLNLQASHDLVRSRPAKRIQRVKAMG